MSPAPLPSTIAWTPPRRAARLATAAALVAVVVHLWALYRDHAPPTPAWFPQADKLEHLVGFGLPCFVVLLALHLSAAASGRRLGTRAIALVVGLFVVHAVVSEIVQSFWTSRTGDPFDTLADVPGTFLGLLGYLAVRRRLGTGVDLGRATGRASRGRA